MITARDITLQFGKEPLFKDVNICFNEGNCYGLIGANGSGKSTFLKILSGDIEPNQGAIDLPKGQRISVLRQDQFAYDEEEVLMTVIMGHKRIYELMMQKEALYAKTPFTDEDGMLVAKIEEELGELDGWSIEAEASKFLSKLGIPEQLHRLKMRQLESNMKFCVLLAQALVGNPDILLLDEPTNHLDMETADWLAEFLLEFKNTAVVVSHDRYFLDKVCTHIADIDFGKIQLYKGNYSFWSESSQLALRQRQDKNKKLEEKRKELKDFIARFSANASKSRQATSRKKILETLVLDEIRPSSRKYPYLEFNFERNVGNNLLTVENLSKEIDGESMFNNFSMNVREGERVAFLGSNALAKTTFFKILMGELTPDSGSYKWGETVNKVYFPKDSSEYFQNDLDVINWLRQFSSDKSEEFIRSFLGKMLFSGDNVFKSIKVLSGGERVRCMLARMMLLMGNVLIMDEPTNHLDLESITALNNGLERFKGTIFLASHDHKIVQTVANRIVEFTPHGVLDKENYTLEEYLQSENIKVQRAALYGK